MPSSLEFTLGGSLAKSFAVQNAAAEYGSKNRELGTQVGASATVANLKAVGGLWKWRGRPGKHRLDFMGRGENSSLVK
jgi:hypothetical protein